VNRWALLIPFGPIAVSVPELEDVNLDAAGHQREVWCLAISPKCYCHYTLDDRWEPHLAEALYINYYLSDESVRVAEAYGRNLVRLAGLKATYDPTDLFRSSHTAKAPT
jgi:hypothetical protein